MNILIYMPSYTVLVALIIFLSSCQSTNNESEKTVTSNKHSIKASPKSYFTSDIHQALGDRGLQLTQEGSIKLVSTEACQIEVSAHRGHFQEPESSSSAIRRALTDNFDSVEIDVMLLKDGTWVNHHDKVSGRATVYYNGERKILSGMDRKSYAGLRLRSKDNSQLLEERPISAYEAFRVFSHYRNATQVLNVEVKSTASGNQLSALDNMLSNIVGQGHYYYSSSLKDVLIKLREINPSVYVGFIQAPHPDSMEKLSKELRSVKSDSFYQNKQNYIEGINGFASSLYRSRYKDYTSIRQLALLKEIFGTNSGLHLDIKSYVSTPQLKGRANRLGLKLYTYSVNGTEYHQDSLASLQKTGLPNGVIIDSSAYRLCQRLFSTSTLKKHNYSPNTIQGKYVSSLPIDADFERLEETLSYIGEGFYVSLDSGVKRVEQVYTSKRITTTDEYGFPIIVDEKHVTHSDKQIIIKLPSNKK
jgi:glycerophosphoryl diester phosphodiesterase